MNTIQKEPKSIIGKCYVGRGARDGAASFLRVIRLDKLDRDGKWVLCFRFETLPFGEHLISPEYTLTVKAVEEFYSEMPFEDFIYEWQTLMAHLSSFDLTRTFDKDLK